MAHGAVRGELHTLECLMTVFDPPTDATVRDGLTAAMTRSGQVERELTRDSARFRVLTGDRPTGPYIWATTSAPCATGCDSKTWG